MFCEFQTSPSMLILGSIFYGGVASRRGNAFPFPSFFLYDKNNPFPALPPAVPLACPSTDAAAGVPLACPSTNTNSPAPLPARPPRETCPSIRRKLQPGKIPGCVPASFPSRVISHVIPLLDESITHLLMRVTGGRSGNILVNKILIKLVKTFNCFQINSLLIIWLLSLHHVNLHCSLVK